MWIDNFQKKNGSQIEGAKNLILNANSFQKFPLKFPSTS